MFQLVNAQIEFPLPPGEALLIGRGEHCDLQLSDASVSRVQCRVLVQGDVVTITDASSRWGTYVNGERIVTKRLRAGDVLSMGETRLELRTDNDPQRTTLPPTPQMAPVENRPISPKSLNQNPVTPLPDLSLPIGLQRDARLSLPADSGHVRGAEPEVLRPGELLGRRFGQYELLEEIGRSNSGMVFRAKDPKGGPDVAVKLFHPRVTADPAVRQRLLRSMHTMLGVQHPQLVTLYKAGLQEGICFLVSEFVDGRSAAAVVQESGILGMLSPQVTLAILIDVASALEHAEELGIVHRNITPANILLTRDHRGKLNDLLLAKSIETDGQDRVTQPGEIVGNLSYLSPESLSNDGIIDHRSDIYQLGATGYALLTGHPPFRGVSPIEIITAIQTRDLVPPSSYQLSTPPLLEGVILRMLAREPSRRHQSLRDLRRDLERVQRYL